MEVGRVGNDLGHVLVGFGPQVVVEVSSVQGGQVELEEFDRFQLANKGSQGFSEKHHFVQIFLGEQGIEYFGKEALGAL